MLARLWAVNDPFPKKVKAIGLVSLAARYDADELTNGSEVTTSLAENLMMGFPEAILYWGVYSKNEHSVEIERQKKTERFERLLPNRHHYVGKLSSSTDECETMIEAASSLTDSFIFVTEGWHSRRARIIWKYFFKGELCFRSIPGYLCADRKNPMFWQRYSCLWALMNIALTPLYKFFPGVSWMAKKNFSQPSN
jgi:hypothetical protein